jgi:hypothetical protein
MSENSVEDKGHWDLLYGLVISGGVECGGRLSGDGAVAQLGGNGGVDTSITPLSFRA